MRLTNTLLIIVAVIVGWTADSLSLQQPQGTAARPSQKKNIAVLGSGGYMGAMTFGFLQRACSLYGTGMGRYQCIGATAQTSIRLNRILSKRFVLATADESKIKLTNLESIDAIREQLTKYDAIILGTDLSVQLKPITLGTYEKTPNDKTWEVFWNQPSDMVLVDEVDTSIIELMATMKQCILSNIVQAAKQANVQHLIIVADDRNEPIDSILLNGGIPYTCIHPMGTLTTTASYSYQKGVISDLDVQVIQDADLASSSSTWKQQQQSKEAVAPLAREDLTAFCIQCLQSLDWTKSRHLLVQSKGVLDPTLVPPQPKKRLDQEWCTNSYRLEKALAEVM